MSSRHQHWGRRDIYTRCSQSIVDSFLELSSHQQRSTSQTLLLEFIHKYILKANIDLYLKPIYLISTNYFNNTLQPNPTSQAMPSSDWEQHFLDKFIAGSSRPASPASPSSQQRTSSPARRNMTSGYTGHQQPHSAAIGRTLSPARLPSNITSAAR